jgi:hypothetical protein
MDDVGRLVEMVLAAEDFGLERTDACAIARAALGRSGELTDSLEDAAGALAERILENVRGELRIAGG